MQRVFDIADINAPPEHLPLVWQLREEHKEETFASLRERWQIEDIVIYDVDEAVSVLRVLDTRTDYLRIVLTELSAK